MPGTHDTVTLIAFFTVKPINRSQSHFTFLLWKTVKFGLRLLIVNWFELGSVL